MFPFGPEEHLSANLFAVARDANASTIGENVFFFWGYV
jgi:hypothetical protein